MVSPVENYFHQSIKTEFVIFSNKVSHQTVYTALYSNRIRLKEVDEHKTFRFNTFQKSIVEKTYHRNM
jgi:hypothetical protein